MRNQLLSPPLDVKVHHTPDAVQISRKSNLFVQNLSYIRVL